MKYIICDKVIASNYGFDSITHRVLGALIILNEKEVTFCTAVEGNSLEEKAAKKERFSKKLILHVQKYKVRRENYFCCS